MFIEAEHHALYRPPNVSRPIDVTPSQIAHIQRRLFVEDQEAVYDFANEGVRCNNVRHALVDDPAVRRLFAAKSEETRIMNLIPGLGQVEIPAKLQRPYFAAVQAGNQALIEIGQRYTAPHDPCFCGRGKKFRKCCGRSAAVRR